MYKVRKIFFNGILVMAILLSVIASTKITVIFNIPIACSFFIFPLVYLSIAVINELGGTKNAVLSLLSSTAILIITYFIITLVLNMPNQVDTINEANAIQLLYGGDTFLNYYIPNIKIMAGSIIGLLVSGFVLIGIYSVISKYTIKTMACFLGTLISSLIFNGIYIVTTQLGTTKGNNFIMMILNRFIFSVAFTIIVSILFMIFAYHKKSKKVINKVVENKNDIEEKELPIIENKIVEKRIVKSDSKLKTAEEVKKKTTKPKTSEKTKIKTTKSKTSEKTKSKSTKPKTSEKTKTIKKENTEKPKK